MPGQREERVARPLRSQHLARSFHTEDILSWLHEVHPQPDPRARLVRLNLIDLSLQSF